MTEIREGRGCEGPQGPHIQLKLDHLGKEVLDSRLPGICEISKTFAHVDPVEAPIPVIPTCHYMMGGIPTRVSGQVISIAEDGTEQDVEGLYAVGEIACVSVHGANRLGGNSLLDLVVFGRANGLHLEQALQDMPEHVNVEDDDIELAMQRYRRWDNNTDGENPADILRDLQHCMQMNFSVFREGQAMHDGLEQLKAIEKRLQKACLGDTTKAFNTQRIECLELDNLMATALAHVCCQLPHRKSRCAFSRGLPCT